MISGSGDGDLLAGIDRGARECDRRHLRTFDALLFDMDGTILDSIAVAERVWGAWASRHGLDAASFVPAIHGRRAIETITQYGRPGVDVEAEAKALLQAELEDMRGIRAIDGAASFLASLPSDRWAVVTSAPRDLAIRRMAAADLPIPAVFVTAEDVTRGKPAPDCFLLAARLLSRRIQDCLVFEDAQAGIAAAEAAGASVMVVTATHRQKLATNHPAIASYDGLRGGILADEVCL